MESKKKNTIAKIIIIIGPKATLGKEFNAVIKGSNILYNPLYKYNTVDNKMLINIPIPKAIKVSYKVIHTCLNNSLLNINS